MTNEKYEIEFSAPLIRPGIVIKAGPLSEKYIKQSIEKVIKIIREINSENESGVIQ